ncbi:MAG TPA: hypothetical protein PLF13_10175 [candidate division Zixibacteria bacterium]|nr:hypothetical protein [candidate division Zixibacteria bacterium]
MRRALFLLSLLGLLMSCGGSDSGIVCENEILENKLYQTESWAEVNSIFDVDSTDSAGLTMAEVMGSMDMMQTTHSLATVITGVVDAEGRLPLVVRLEATENVQIVNGDTVEAGLPASLDSALETSGSYFNGEVVLDAVEGIDPVLITLAKGMVVQLINSVAFPTDAIEKGETFSYSMPLNLPFPEASSASMETVYTLDEYDDNIARFSIDQALSGADGVDFNDIGLLLAGSGEVVYDRNNKNISLVELLSDMTIPAAVTGRGFGSTLSTKVKFTVKTTDAE